MEEHGSSKPLVGGSSPSGSTTFEDVDYWLGHSPFKAEIWVQFPIALQLRVCSIVVNVPDCQSGDWSSILPHPANPLLIY